MAKNYGLNKLPVEMHLEIISYFDCDSDIISYVNSITDENLNYNVKLMFIDQKQLKTKKICSNIKTLDYYIQLFNEEKKNLQTDWYR